MAPRPCELPQPTDAGANTGGWPRQWRGGLEDQRLGEKTSALRKRASQSAKAQLPQGRPWGASQSADRLGAVSGWPQRSDRPRRRVQERVDGDRGWTSAPLGVARGRGCRRRFGDRPGRARRRSRGCLAAAQQADGRGGLARDRVDGDGDWTDAPLRVAGGRGRRREVTGWPSRR
jgi:hypothetical protein